MMKARIHPLSALLAITLFAGCADTPRGAPTTARPGGVSRFESGRLARSRLVDIRADPKLTWEFDGDRFEVSCDGGLPPDIARPLLGDEASAQRIGGRWRLDDTRPDGTRDTLVLEVADDDTAVARRLELPIEAAGAVRCNLGERQYNVFE